MNNKLNAIATFLRVAEAGSFSAAARQSGMKQSAVSQQIAALEESLGVVLLHRTTRVMALTGQGDLNLLKEECDMRFNVRVLGGWKGESKLIDKLKQTAIPLRIYGKWQALSYSLQVDQVLRKQLQDEAKQRLNDWIERNKNSQDGKEVKKLLEKH